MILTCHRNSSVRFFTSAKRSYSHYETGSRGIPVEMLIRLADYYDTTIDYLVGRTDNKEPIKPLKAAK